MIEQAITNPDTIAIKIDSDIAAVLQEALPENVQIVFDADGQAFLTGQVDQIRVVLSQLTVQEFLTPEAQSALEAEVTLAVQKIETSYQRYHTLSELHVQEERFGELTGTSFATSGVPKQDSIIDQIIAANRAETSFDDIIKAPLKNTGDGPLSRDVSLVEDVSYELQPLKWYAGGIGATDVTMTFWVDGSPGLPSWMSYDLSTGKISGTPDNGNVGVHTLKIIFTSGLSFSEVELNVAVQNVNDAPTTPVDADAVANTVAENSANGTIVGVTAQASDIDVGTTLVYSLIDSAGGRFAINASTGVVTIANSSLINYEANASHSITVRVSDGVAYSDQTFTVAVTDVNDAPVAANATFSVAENTGAGAVLGNVTATDQDAGDTKSWSIVSGNGSGLFALSSSGQLTLAGSPNFETAASHTLVVRVTDAGGLTSDSTVIVNITNVNEAPVAANATFTVAENSGIGTVVGNAPATDVDAGDTKTWSILSGNGAGLFALSSSGQLTLAASPNYEAGGTYNLVVRVTDAGGLSSDSTLTVNVTNVNEAPVATGATYSVVENTAAGAVLGSLTATDQDAGDTKTWSIVSGNGSGLFAMSAAGQLTLAGAPNYEAASSHTLVVRVTDAGGLTSDATVIVNVTNVNEAPVAANATYNVAENSSVGSVVGIVSATDQDAGDTKTWSIVSGNGSGLFALSSSGQLTLASSPDYEAGTTHTLVVRVTDSGGLSSDSTVTVNVTNVNEAPVTANASFSVVENTGTGAVLGSLSASDQDAGDTKTWSIVSGNGAGLFALSSSGQLTLAASPNYEAGSSHNLVVRVTDAGGLTSDATVTVTVTNVNEAPVTANSNVIVAANRTPGELLTTLSATDQDAGDTETWSIVSGNGAGVFALSSSGQLTLAGTPGNVGDVYSLVVRVTDSGGLTSDSTVTLTVGVPNLAPDADDATFTVAENTASGAVLGMLTATDPDVGDTKAWSIVSGNGSGLFALSASGQLTLAGSPNFETAGTHTLVVRVTDAGGLTNDATVTVNVTNVNEAPVAANASLSIAENSTIGTVVGNLSATDPDVGDTKTWSIVSGNGAGLFTLSSSGQLTLAASPNYEAGSSYNLVVRVTDAGGLSSTSTIAVSVTNVNDAPVASGATFTVAENTGIGAVLGSVSATDQDAGDTKAWSIVSGNGAGLFALSAGGQLTLAASPDYEAGGTYSLVVRVTDAGGLTSDATVTVNVTNVNEAPVASNATYSVAENTSAGAVVATLAATDPDAGDTKTWSIVSGNGAGLFALSSSGQLTLTGSPNYEATNAYSLVVRVTDGSGVSSNATITVNVTNVNEAPVASGATYSVAENASAGAVLGTLSATDVDAGDTKTWSIVSGNGSGLFALSSSGELTLAGSPNYETATSHSLVVRVTDAGGLTSDTTVVVNVTNVNEAPVAANATYSVAENTGSGALVGNLSATDVDAGDTKTWSIVSGNGAGLFALSSSGQLTLAGTPNFESAASYSLVVRVTDAGGLTSDSTITVNVTNVNEAPVATGASFTVAEDVSVGTVLGNVTSTDVDAGDTAIWSIVSGNANGYFALSSSGQLTIANAPDYETATSYTLTVRVTDSGGLTSDSTVTVAVTNVNEAPIANNDALVVAENSAFGTVIGNLTAGNMDVGDTHTWAILSGNNSGKFALSPSGELTLVGLADYEGVNSYNLVVRVTDSGGLFSDATVNVSFSNVNEAPVATYTTYNVAENAISGDIIGTLNSTDVDPGDTRTWNIVSGNGAGLFSLSSVGQLTLVGSLNHEAVSAYNLVVRVTDAGGLTSDATITVNVTNVNEAPVAANAAFNIGENVASGAVVGNLSATDPDASDTKTWSIVSGNGSGLFALSSNGQLTLANSSGTSSMYNLVVRVTDAGGLTSDSTVSINVTNVNNAPVADNAAFNVAENTSIGAVVGNLTATDTDLGDTKTWTIVSGNGAGLFTLSSSGQLTLAASPNFEVAGTHTLVVRVTDTGGLTSNATITVNVTNVNEAPVPAGATYNVGENVSSGMLLGSLTATDVDAGDTKTWSIVSGNGAGIFNLSSGGQLTLATSSGSSAVYNLVVRVTDAGGLSNDTTVTVNVTNVNDTPVADNATFSVVENTMTGSVVGMLTATDADVGDIKIWSIVSGNNAGLFALSTGGQLTLAGAPNYEAGGSYNLVVRVTDSHGAHTDATITVNITDVNEAPVTAAASFAVTTSNHVGDVLGTVTATDDDAGDTQTWTIVAGNDDGLFALSSSGQMTLASTPGVGAGGTYNVVARVTDAGGLSHDVTVNINVSTNAGSAPVVAAQFFELNENSADGTLLYRVGGALPQHSVDGSDADGNTITWSIGGGSGAAIFDIDGATGELSVSGTHTLNFEGSYIYTLIVNASDGTGNTSQGTITINLKNVNEAPVAQDASVTIYSGLSAGSVIQTMSVMDPDAGDTRSWAIVSGNNGLFSINSQGQLTVTQAPSNFGPTSYTLVVETTDAGGLSDTASVNVTIGSNTAPNIAFGTLAPIYDYKPCPITGVTIVDPDAGQLMRLTMALQMGTVTVDTTVVGGLIASQITGNGTSSLVITGATVAQMNATFATNGIMWSKVSAGTFEIITMTLSDGAVTTPINGGFSVLPNVGPSAGAPLPAQDVAADSIWHYTVNSNAFSDGSGDTLTYTATMQDGSPLLSFLTFDAGTRTFTSTAMESDVGLYQIKLIATDQGGLTSTQTLALDIHSGAQQNVIGDGDATNVWGTWANEVIIGLGGADNLKGGGGNDVFAFGAGDSTSTDTDIILDFKAGDDADKIDLSALLNVGFGDLVFTVENTMGGPITHITTVVNGHDFALDLKGEYQPGVDITAADFIF